MEKNYSLIDLTEKELKDQNGGFPNILHLDNPIAFWIGLFEGWQRSTQF